MEASILNYFALSQTLSPVVSILAVILFAWSISWKGMALWHASQHKEKIWFIALLVINTVGILEIVYMFHFSKNKITPSEAIKFIKTLNYKKLKSLLTT